MNHARDKYRIVFYCESDILGGHERMALAAHSAIGRYRNDIEIKWVVSRRSERLIEALEAAGFDYELLAQERPFSIWRRPFHAFRIILKNASILRRSSPNLVLIIQGGILLSFAGTLSARIARTPFCSYIPMVTRISDTRDCAYPALADFAWRFLYKGVSAYITIDREQADRLRRVNPSASVRIVENYVPRSAPSMARQQAREALGIPAGKLVLSVIGRIAFAQKRQDWIVRVLKDDPFMEDKIIVFAGDGPDASALRDMLAPEDRDRFTYLGWRDDIPEILAATDLLLIPSKLEGVPLVMLEALGSKIPVVGSDCDGMRDWLPAGWRFSSGDEAGLKIAVRCALEQATSEVWEALLQRLASIHDERRFASEFAETLLYFATKRDD